MELTPEVCLRKMVCFKGEKKALPVAKESKLNLKIALIASERITSGFSSNANVALLTEENWRLILKYGRCDFLLVESCMQTSTSDWYLGQQQGANKEAPLLEVVDFANSLGIPTIYWHTLDEEYLDLFRFTLAAFDKVYCADNLMVETLKEEGIETTLLLPAVQPTEFSCVTQSERASNTNLVKGFSDGLSEVILDYPENSKFYNSLAEIGVTFADSTNLIWQSKFTHLDLPISSIAGCVQRADLPSMITSSSVYCLLKSKNLSFTENCWRALEAMSCKVPVLTNIDFCDDHFLRPYLHVELEDEAFLANLEQLAGNDLDNERFTQRTWREVTLNHTFSKRLETICSDISLDIVFPDMPKVTMITPTFRLDYIERALKQFQQLNYNRKEWIVVFNGDHADLNEVTAKVKKLDGAQVVFVPPELHAGACMNVGINLASGDYVFRMDDDDYYGQNYILDIILYSRLVNFDVTGKFFQYFHIAGSADGPVYELESFITEMRFPTFFRKSELTYLPHISGATQGGKRSFFLNNPYPHVNFASVDAHWIGGIKSEAKGSVLITEGLNFVVERRLDNSHTWHIDADDLVNSAKRHDISVHSFLGQNE